jgi:hypothetical protein
MTPAPIIPSRKSPPMPKPIFPAPDRLPEDSGPRVASACGATIGWSAGLGWDCDWPSTVVNPG